MMKSILFFCALICCSGFLHAQYADVQAVASRVKLLDSCLLHPDRNRLERLADDSLSYGHSGGKLQNKTEFVNDLVNGPFHFLTVSVADETISITGNIAIVRHKLSFDFSNNGTNGSLTVGNLLIWRKTNKEWKLLARQAYKL